MTVQPYNRSHSYYPSPLRKGRWRARSAAPEGIRALIILPLILAACVSDPITPVIPPVVTPGTNGVLIINEGVWGQDNGTLTLYNPTTKQAAAGDYFTAANPTLRLGDVANSITTWNGRGYIAVTGSRTVEMIEMKSGLWRGRLRLANVNQPRLVVIIDSSTACVTTLADSVIVFNPLTMERIRSFPTGPAPEGIAFAAGKIFVANSGFGTLRQNEPRAGTLSVFDPDDGRETASITTGPNPRIVRYLASVGHLFVGYGLADSLGGLLEIDPLTATILHRWELPNLLDVAFDERLGRAYALAGNNVVRVDIKNSGSLPETILRSETWPGSIFYSIGVSPASGDICIGKTEGYSPKPAEVVVADGDGRVKLRFACGIYPGDVGFY